MEQRNGFTTGFVLGALALGLGALALYKKRRHLRAAWWQWQAKADIHRRLAALKRVTRASYDEIVDDVLARYEAAGEVAADEIEAFAGELKRRYGEIKARLAEAREALEDE